MNPEITHPTHVVCVSGNPSLLPDMYGWPSLFFSLSLSGAITPTNSLVVYVDATIYICSACYQLSISLSYIKGFDFFFFETEGSNQLG